MRTSAEELNVYCLKSISGSEIDWLFVMTETNTGPKGQMFLFKNELPLKKGVDLHFENLNPLHLRLIYAKFG